MKLNEAFPTKYLSAGDLAHEKYYQLTIRLVQFEEIGQKKERKPVAYFNETEKGLVLNKTNSFVVAELTGSDDTDDWPGHRIAIYRTEVAFAGDMVDTIRVQKRKFPKPGAAPAPALASEPVYDDRPPSRAITDDEIPF